MGTRSLTVLEDEQGREIAVMYRQFDGYPSGHGQELADFLRQFTVVNGLSSGQPQRVANGAGCLAAQVVAQFKSKPGDIYLHAAGTRDCGEEWVYTVGAAEGKPTTIRVQAGCVTAFGLPGTKQKSMPVLFDGTVADFEAALIEKAYADMGSPPADARNRNAISARAARAALAKAAP